MVSRPEEPEVWGAEVPRIRRPQESMALLDRLAWDGGLAFSAYGLPIGVRVTDRAVLGQVIDHLPPGWKPSSSPIVDKLYTLVVGDERQRGRRRFNVVYNDPERLARATDLGALLELFESSLHMYVAEFARRRIFVHAGVVGWQGQAIVIPGTSMSGKSTLVVALIRAGATFYSDEFAVLDSDGRVYPFPRPLSLREGPGGRARRYPAESLGAAVGKKPLPVGLVGVIRHRPGARWRPRRLSAGEGTLALLANTVAARRAPELAFQSLARVASSALVLKGVRGEADEAAAALLRVLMGAGGWGSQVTASQA